MVKFHHEYQLAGTADAGQSPVFNSPKRWNTRFLIFILAILGTIAGVILLVIFSFKCNLIDCQIDNLNVDSTLASGISGNISTFSEEFEENEGEENPYEKWFKTTLSESEKDDLKKLREKVEEKLTHDYMRTNSYLKRWLIAREWNVEDAEEMLLNHLEWRAEFDIDSVLETNFTFYEQEYPGYYDGVDYRGGPVVSMSIEDWDLRKVSIGGYQREFLRYCFRHFEWGVQLILDKQEKGLNVTQAMFIMNVNRYTFAQHACFSCISVMGQFLFGMDDNYPGWLHHIIIINASELASAVIDMMVPYLNGENRDAFKVFGFNKTEWQTKILSLTAADQIRTEFGGTRVDLEE